jgi:hypothetical protein
MNVSLTLEGGSSSLTITSIDIKARSPRAGEPFAGTLVCEPGAGGEPKIQLFADMDSPEPVFLSGMNSTQRYFRDNVITLKPDEQVNLSAMFRAEHGFREFELVINYVQNGKEGVVPVPAPRGGRYALTGYATRYGAVYEGSPHGAYRLVENPRPCSWMPASQEC